MVSSARPNWTSGEELATGVGAMRGRQLGTVLVRYMGFVLVLCDHWWKEGTCGKGVADVPSLLSLHGGVGYGTTFLVRLVFLGKEGVLSKVRALRVRAHHS